MVWVQLPLGWDTIYFSTLILSALYGRPMTGRQKTLFPYSFFFAGALIVGGWKVLGLGRKSCLRPAQVTSFSRRDVSWSSKHDTTLHVVLTGYFYFLLLWIISVSDFRPLEFYENLILPLPITTFTVSSYTYNHFYKYI